MSTEIQEIMAKIDAMAADLAELKERVAALADAAPAATDQQTDEEPTEPRPEPRRQWAFTINDRYRFRRELFGNSDAEMIDTLELLAAMSSADEAEEYLFDDLGWDRTNDDVADFMAIVRRRFADRPSALL